MSRSEKITRSRDGCASCKKRRVRCDLTVPVCMNCNRRGTVCPGYRTPIRWSQKYERFRGNHFQHESPREVRTESPPMLEVEQDLLSPFASTDALTRDHGLLGENEALAGVLSPLGATPGCVGFHLHSLDYRLSGDRVDKAIPSRCSGSQIGDFGLSSDDYSHPLKVISTLPSTEGRPEDFREAVTSNPGIPYKSPSILASLSTQADILSRHYFSVVCVINSGFDSRVNPFRVYVAESLTISPVIYHCVLSMSAAHLHQQSRESQRMVQEHRLEAIASMRNELDKTEDGPFSTDDRRSSASVLLLGTLLLGMSSTWHDVSSLGTTYLYGARAILKIMIANDHYPSTSLPLWNTSEGHFLIGAIAFWEALSSFHLDQTISSIDYLDQFCDKFGQVELLPNPWTGLHTKLFVLVAKVGIVSRQSRVLGRASCGLPMLSMESGTFHELYDAASELESQIRNYTTDTPEHNQDTCDHLTPVAHFEIMARIYQTTMLLELYQVFPGLLHRYESNQSSQRDPDYASHHKSNHTSVLVTLAVHILTLFLQIPSTSGTKAIQLLPLVIAGSALQHSGGDTTISQALDTPCIDRGMTALSTSKVAITHWRSIVRTALSAVSRYVGLDSAQRGISIVEEVWLQADLQTWAAQQLDSSHDAFVYWADVMRDERLETLLG